MLSPKHTNNESLWNDIDLDCTDSEVDRRIAPKFQENGHDSEDPEGCDEPPQKKASLNRYKTKTFKLKKRS